MQLPDKEQRKASQITPQKETACRKKCGVTDIDEAMDTDGAGKEKKKDANRIRLFEHLF